MSISSKTTKIAILLAIIAIAGLFIYQGVAGPMKIITTGTATVKINANLGQAKINISQAGKLTNGLVGHWTFDGQDTNWGANTTDDVSANSNIGTMTSMSTTTSPVPGVAGQAMNFDGINDYINTSNNQNIDMTGNMTISAWIYSKGSSNNQTIVSKAWCDPEFQDAGSPYAFSITSINKMDYQSGDFTFSCGYTSDITSSNSISLNQWQHIVLVRDSSQLKVTFYLNSLQDSGGWQTYSVPSGGATLRIGSLVTDRYNGVNEPSSFFNGAIDELRFYNRALSASEVTELYNQGR